jgi:hypothetical protein
VVRIHAGEPPLRFNNLQDKYPVVVRILYQRLDAVQRNSLTLLEERAEHGFEAWNQEGDWEYIGDHDIADIDGALGWADWQSISADVGPGCLGGATSFVLRCIPSYANEVPESVQ